VAQADVMVEAFRPGVMERLGLGAAVMRELNPRLIYCSISGFGQGSEVSDRPAYAPVVHASSGFDWAQGQDEEGRPVGSAVPMADILTAMFAVMAIQSALLARRDTGRGAFIDANLMDSVMNVLPYEFQAAQMPAEQPRPSYKPLRAKDGFVLVTPINAKNFRNLCEALGHPEWTEDPLLATDTARFANWTEYMRRIEAWTIERTAAECEAILSAQGVPCSRYRRIGEAMRDPQFTQRDSFAPISDGRAEYLATRLPFTLDGMRPLPGARIPAHGADTAQILSEWLHLSKADVDTLQRERAVICQS